MPIDDEVNFEAAEDWLRKAKEAHAAGDVERYMESRYLLAVALNITTGVHVSRVHTGHLKAS